MSSAGGINNSSTQNYTNIQFDESGSFSISTNGSQTPAIPIDEDGCVDLNELTSILSKETGIKEEVIIKDYLPGIVSTIEAHGEYKLKGLELLKDMATDRMDDSKPVLGAGPTGVTANADEETKLLLQQFQENGIYINPSASGNQQLIISLSKDLQAELTTNNNSNSVSQSFAAKLERYMQDFPNGDIMASLFYVFQESIKQTNEDKKYFLGKLSDMNKLSESMSSYLKDLESLSQQLESKTVDDMENQGKDYQAGSTTIEANNLRSYDTSGTLDKDGNAIYTQKPANSKMNNTALAAEIKSLETDMETVRNKREEFQTMFENFDQKSNQLFNMLSTVLKNVKEMQSSVTRNLL